MTALFSLPPNVNDKLASMDLTNELLLNSVRSGVLARKECTANHPPIYAGISAWANAVRTLREQLLPKGWSRSDEDNYSLVIHPTGALAIALATGDENTGSLTSIPMTKSPKGPSTQLAVAKNLSQMSLFQDFDDFRSTENLVGSESRLTWLLLIARIGEKVKSELSLPINCVGKVDAWQERIILPDIEIDPSADIFVDPIIPQMPDIDIAIQRKVG